MIDTQAPHSRLLILCNPFCVASEPPFCPGLYSNAREWQTHVGLTQLELFSGGNADILSIDGAIWGQNTARTLDVRGLGKPVLRQAASGGEWRLDEH